MPITTVRTRSATSQSLAHVRLFGGAFSHDEELPLKVRVRRTSWLGRMIRVTTTEEVSYRDAVTYIRVPVGFSYDLASIPRPVWCVVSPWDIALESLFHDLLYRQAGTPHTVKRSQADFVFRSMMEDRGVPWLIRWMVYLGVRAGGWKAWRKWARRNAAAAASGTVIDHDPPSALAPDEVE